MEIHRDVPQASLRPTRSGPLWLRLSSFAKRGSSETRTSSEVREGSEENCEPRSTSNTRRNKNMDQDSDEEKQKEQSEYKGSGNGFRRKCCSKKKLQSRPERKLELVKIPKPIDRVRPPTNLTYEQLPEKIKRKCMDSDVPLQQYQDDIEILFRCAKFLYASEFEPVNVDQDRSTIFTNAPLHIVQKGQNEIKKSPKSLARMFSCGVETGSGQKCHWQLK
eukprot:TRINITY_DN3632_c0_g2_i1.p1 TRINITY_DN3632_c0_g2~~TRINITY_DN3632_c0_g2_i1.p1  ORF type:complete len:220 (+),score=32.17 TRINITY_DN3632_c0_g2_i1:198-857(+)